MSDPESSGVGVRPAQSPFLRFSRAAIGYLIAAACLVWVFHDVQFSGLLEHMASITWSWVAAGIVFDVLSYLCQGYRWHWLLKPTGKISTWRTTQAVYAGLFLNEILPMRIGELARGYLVSRWIPASLVRVIPSMALERLFEGIWLAVGIGATAIFVPLPRNLVKSADVLGVIVLVLTAAFVVVTFRSRRESHQSPKERPKLPKFLQSLRQALDHLRQGFQAIGLRTPFYVGFAVTFFLFAFQAFSFWFIMRSFHLNLSFWAGAAVFLIVHFGTALPNAPANVGSYQFFCVLGLALFGIDKTLATSFSIVVFILLTLPLLVLGFFALGQSGMSFSSIRKNIADITARSKK